MGARLSVMPWGTLRAPARATQAAPAHPGRQLAGSTTELCPSAMRPCGSSSHPQHSPQTVPGRPTGEGVPRRPAQPTPLYYVSC